MPWFFIPDHITIGLDKPTRDLIEKALDLPATQARINSLADRLAQARGSIAAALAANPDPNPDD